MTELTPEAERLIEEAVKMGKISVPVGTGVRDYNNALEAYKASIEPKKARRGSLKCNSPDKSEWCTGIEATPSVEVRLGETAGVSRDEIIEVFKINGIGTGQDVNAIIELIASKAPPVEDK